jgi:hypothetical protein
VRPYCSANLVATILTAATARLRHKEVVMNAFIATVLAGSLAGFWIFLAVCRAIAREDRPARAGKPMATVAPSPVAAMARRIVAYRAEVPHRVAMPTVLHIQVEVGSAPDEMPPPRLAA